MSKQKYIQNTQSLRLLLSFDKFSGNKEVVKAYNFLNINDKGKAMLITDAILYYDSLKVKDSAFDRAISDMRSLKCIKHIYSIECRDDLKKLLEQKPESKAYKYICRSIGTNKSPAKMLCGFSKDSDKSTKMHNRLFNLPVNERINLISAAVNKYVEDNKVPYFTEKLAFRFLRDVIDCYQMHPEKQEIILNDLYILMAKTKEIESIKNEGEKSVA